MDVVGRDGDSVLIADGPAGAVLLPGGQVLVGPLAVLVRRGQWRDASGAVPDHAPRDLAGQLADARAELEAQS